MAEIPQWHVSGDWFDVCSCDIACPCIFGQPPTNNICQGVLAYRVREGHFGIVTLANLKLVLVVTFEGNIWASQATGFKLGLFLDSSADAQQQEALQTIFSGQAGGIPARLSAIWGPPEVVGMEVVPIDFEVAGDRAFWRAEVPGKVAARAEALTGPMTPPGQRVQLLNAPGSEVGPGQVQGHDAPGGRSGAQMGGGRQVEQAHSVRLVGPTALLRQGIPAANPAS